MIAVILFALPFRSYQPVESMEASHGVLTRPSVVHLQHEARLLSFKANRLTGYDLMRGSLCHVR